MGLFSSLNKWWNTVDDPNVLKQYERRMDDWYNDPFRKESSRPVAPPMCTPGRECQPTGMYRNEFNAVPEAPEVVQENWNHRKKRQRELETAVYGHSEYSPSRVQDVSPRQWQREIQAQEQRQADGQYTRDWLANDREQAEQAQQQAYIDRGRAESERYHRVEAQRQQPTQRELDEKAGWEYLAAQVVQRQQELETAVYGHREHQEAQQRNTPRAEAWRKYDPQPEQRHEFNPGRGSAPKERNVGYPVQIDQPIEVPNWPQRREQSIMDKMLNGVQDD